MLKKQQKLSQLKAEWDKKLKDSGFVDIEGKRGSIKTYDRRTQSFDQRNEIRDFFLALDAYIVNTELKPLHKSILELYSKGIKIIEIVKIVKRSRANIYQIINLHSREILWKK